MSCVYCGKDGSFTKVEHVIPAAIGGTAVLARGIVCDTCNGDLFSKLEERFARFSIISISRDFLGPGKRGRTVQGLEDSSTVKVVTKDGDVALCVVAAGKPYLIEQIKIRQLENNQFQVQYSLDKTVSDSYLVKMRAFAEKLKSLPERYVSIDSSQLTGNEMILGQHNGKWFRSTKDFQKIEIYTAALKRMDIEKFSSESKYQETYQERPTIHVNQPFDLRATDRIIAKMALNTFILRYGSVLADNRCFDEIKEFILHWKGTGLVKLNPQSGVDAYKDLVHKFSLPEQGHTLGFTVIDGNLFCLVSLYGGQYTFTVTLAEFDTLQSEIHSLSESFLISDWRNHRDLFLHEFLKEKVSGRAGHEGTPLPAGS